MQTEILRRIVARAAAGLVLAMPLAAALPANAASSAKADTFKAIDIDSFAGAFLAARVADADNDDASAIDFYRRALDFDPDNLEVKERLMVTLFMTGDFDRGAAIAQEIKNDPAVDRVTAIARGLQAIRKHDYASARKIFAYDGDNDLDRLMSGLLTAWAQFGAGQKKEAITAVDDLKGPEWFAVFKNYTAGLMAQASGRLDKARTFYKAAITDPTGDATAPDTFMRAVIALAEMEATSGSKKAALDAVATGEQFSPGYPPLDAVRQAVEKGDVQERPVKTAAQGAATVMFSIGSALNRRGAEEVVSLYLNFSEALDPSNPATRVMLGGIAEALNKPQDAIKIYDGIPKNSPMRRLSDLQRGLDLAQIGKVPEAEKQLRDLIAKDPSDMRSYLALGAVFSDAKDYKQMAGLYDQAAAKVGTVPEASDWNIFFQRGIAYERLKDWPKAEPNFKKALDLSPDQPQVLNYLGYSWIDRNMHLEDGLKMIQKAVSLRPNDGYIVDSLGWAFYKLGQFDKAVDQLEHAVELKPGDATINDHLGDAYWQVGRKIEAVYQWNRSLTFKPDADQIPLLKEKIKNGLPAPVNGRPVSIEAEMKNNPTPPKAPASSPPEDRKSELSRPATMQHAALDLGSVNGDLG